MRQSLCDLSLNVSPAHYICCKSLEVNLNVEIKSNKNTYLNPQIIVVLEHFAICGAREKKNITNMQNILYTNSRQ